MRIESQTKVANCVLRRLLLSPQPTTAVASTQRWAHRFLVRSRWQRGNLRGEADGSGLIHLTSNPAWDSHPSWSPDGTRIAFVSKRDGNEEIYVMNADGSGLMNLTNNPADDYSPSWSPDSARLAFTSKRDGNEEIYVMNADSSGPTRLTNNPAKELGLLGGRETPGLAEVHFRQGASHL